MDGRLLSEAGDRPEMRFAVESGGMVAMARDGAAAAEIPQPSAPFLAPVFSADPNAQK